MDSLTAVVIVIIVLVFMFMRMCGCKLSEVPGKIYAHIKSMCGKETYAGQPGRMIGIKGERVGVDNFGEVKRGGMSAPALDMGPISLPAAYKFPVTTGGLPSQLNADFRDTEPFASTQDRTFYVNPLAEEKSFPLNPRQMRHSSPGL
jgi:hypothetical protein